MSQVNKKTTKPTKTTQVMERLQADILNGTLAPDERLLMDSLKDRYGTSVSPLREALAKLTVSGFVRVEEQCGFCVSSLSLKELEDIYLVRAHIEDLALQLAISNGDANWEADILSSWHKFSRYIDPRVNKKIDPVEWDRLQRVFLFSLVKNCGSDWLLKIRELLYDQAARYRVASMYQSYENEEVLLGCIENGERLVAAVLAKDVKESCRISREAFSVASKIIAEALKNSEYANK